MKNMNLKVFSMILLFSLSLPLATLAFTAENGNTIYIGKDKTVDGNLYAAGASVVVDGRVTGDIVCAGQSISINGKVDGDVLCAGQSLFIGGEVGGNVRVAGNSIRLDGKIARNLNAIGANVDISNNAKVGWDALTAAASVQVNGEIGRSLLGAGANYFLNSKIGGDAVLYLSNGKQQKNSDLTIADSASINGKLEYTAVKDATISSKSQIKGEKIRHIPDYGQKQTARRFSALGYAGFSFFSMITALVLGYALMLLFRKPLLSLIDEMPVNFWPFAGWGLLWIVATPIISLLLAISMFGLRLAGLAMLIYALIMMVAKIVAAIAFGRWLLNRYWKEKIDSAGWIVASGVIIAWIIFAIPFLGWLISAIALCWGTGALLIHIKNMQQQSAEK